MLGNPMTVVASWLLQILVAVVLCVPLPSQCATGWLPGDSVPGTNGEVHALAHWDPDGPGPLPSVVVVGGSFTVAGTAVANNVATWDPATEAWSALGQGVNSTVRAIASMPNGELVVGGDFTAAGGVSARRVARWDGVAWSTLGVGGSDGVNNTVRALTVLQNGDLVAGGDFDSAGTLGANGANRVARWNGQAWSPMGTGLPSAVRALIQTPSGVLIAGGSFSGYLAQWSGQGWALMGGPNNQVDALAVASNGDLIVGGSFTSAGSVSYTGRIARWDGSSWSSLGSFFSSSGFDSGVTSIAMQPNGRLAVGGHFTSIGSVQANRVAEWDGSAWVYARWSSLAAGMDARVNAVLSLPSGGLLAGGNFSSAGGSSARCIARWDSVDWRALGAGVNDQVYATLPLPSGEVVLGGNFKGSGSVRSAGVVVWDGSSWSPLGGGLGGTVHALVRAGNGDIIAGGSLTLPGGGSSVARWNGSIWSSVGALVGPVYALAVRSDGSLLAGGDSLLGSGSIWQRVAVWDGLAWSALSGIQSGRVNALAVMPSGAIAAGGTFGAGRIALWQGASWVSIGSGMDGDVNALAVMPDGSLVAGGLFGAAGGTSAACIARWNGVTWTAFGLGAYGRVLAISPLPSGDLIAGGEFSVAGGVGVNFISRWGGGSWTPLGSGVNGFVRALALRGGELVVGGDFAAADGAASSYFARLATSCAALANPVGSPCPTSSGQLSLSANALPWVGSTFRSDCVNVPVGAQVLSVLGFSSPGLPLNLYHPAGGAGCMIYASPDAFQLIPSVAGRAAYSFAIPNSPVFAGFQLFHQMLAVELGPSANIARIASSNAVAMTLGVF